MGPSNDIHVSNRVESPTSPQGRGGGGGGGSHVTMIGSIEQPAGHEVLTYAR